MSTISGKQIKSVTVAHTPHKLAWYYGDKAKYLDDTYRKTIGKASPYASGGNQG